jgi:hypothetical protein
VQATERDVTADAVRDERVDEEGDGGGAAPSWSSPAWALPLAVYAAVFAVLVVVSWQVITHITVTPDGVPPVEFRGEWFWDGWVRYDAGWYTMIVDNGYSYTPGTQSPVAFFPGYPLVVRAVSRVIDNTPLAGIAVTVACGAGAVVLFHRWCRDRLDPRVSATALLCLALYPYAYYLYGAMYGDALFLLCAVGAFLAFERDHLVLAGLAGAVATGTRLVGVAVVVGLVVGVCERRGVFARAEGRRVPGLHLDRLRLRDGWVLLSLGGLAAWSGWLWARYGDPLLFSTVQESWGQQAGPATWVKRDFFLSIIQRPGRFYSMGLVIQATFGLAVAASILPVARRFGWRYGAYVGALVLVPVIGSQDFQGLGRYLLGAFPSFALAGVLLAGRPGVRRAVLPLSAAVLVVFAGMFANGRYIS